MTYFCTLSDKKYLLQGLALYHSLCRFEKDFCLYWLCLDDETYDTLCNSEFENIIPFKLSDLEAVDKELRQAKSNPAGEYGTQYSQYCWALTPYFMDLLLNNDLIPAGECLMYVDSDIVFYHSPRLILDVIAEKSIGIHSHRYGSKYDPLKNPVGEFNVGVVVIRNNTIGRACAAWWKNCLLQPNHRYYKIYGTCGDQKYLDLFKPLFGDVCVFDQPTPLSLGRGVGGEGIGYLAPWCVDNVRYLDDGNIVYNGHAQSVVFYHFSHFNYDFRQDAWRDSNKGEWNPCRFPEINKYYENYFSSIKKINSQLLIKNA